MKTMINTYTAFALFALACFALSPRDTQGATIYPSNNGFEVPDMGGGYNYSPSGAGWTFLSPYGFGAFGTGIAANGSAFNVMNAPNGNSDGTTSTIGQAAFFQGGDGTLASGIYFYQTINGFQAGTASVSFLLESRGPYPMYQLMVTLDDTVLGTFSTISSDAFVPETTISVPVTAGSHTLYFIPNGLNDNNRDGFVDSVSIDNIPTLTYSAQVQQPINLDGSSVFNVRRGVVPVKFTLTQDGVATCTLPPATIVVTRTAGGTTGPIDESIYTGSADTGSNFRIDSCQYVYNLSASALGLGTYRVEIKINNQVVGSGIFQWK